MLETRKKVETMEGLLGELMEGCRASRQQLKEARQEVARLEEEIGRSLERQRAAHDGSVDISLAFPLEVRLNRLEQFGHLDA